MVNICNQIKESMFFILCRLDFEYHDDVLERGGDLPRIHQYMACKKCADECVDEVLMEFVPE